MDLSAYQHCYEMEVRDHELDAQGIVNNAHYLHYLEHARHKFLNQIELDFVGLAQRGVNLVVVRVVVVVPTTNIGEELLLLLLVVVRLLLVVSPRNKVVAAFGGATSKKLCETLSSTTNRKTKAKRWQRRTGMAN